MKQNDYFKISAPSSEEEFITNFFKDSKIKFKREVPLTKLYGDDKRYREVDFYLPRLKVFVEYFGLYNENKDTRAAYKKKVDVYIKNSIPTIFLYPHELGILEYAFHRKLVKLLKVKKFNLRKQLYRHRTHRFFDKTRGVSGNLGKLVLASYIFYAFFTVHSGLSDDFNTLIIFLCGLLMIGSFIGLIKDVRQYFFLDK